MEDNQSVSDYVNNFVSGIVEYLPVVLGSLLLLLIGYIIAKVVSAVVHKGLQAVNLNQHLRAGQGGNLIQRAVPDPAGLISKIVYWLLFLFALSVAITALGVPALNQIVQGIYAYIPNIIAAFLIFLVAGAVSASVATLVSNTMGHTPTGKVAASVAPVLVMGIATFMILNQLKIAPEIVTITYAGLVGTATLAFGLGGRDAASRLFMDLYEAGQRNKSAVARDFKVGAASAKSKSRDLKNRAS